MVSVKATRRFHYSGKDIAVGEFVEMSPTDALVHGRRRNVTLSKQARPSQPKTAAGPPLEPAPLPDDRSSELHTQASEPTRTRRTYRRRDLTPTHTTVLVPEPPPEPSE